MCWDRSGGGPTPLEDWLVSVDLLTSEETRMEQADPTDDCVLQVHGITDDMPLDILTLYFESNRRSGGGTITSTKRQGDYALITFENPTDAQSVLSKPGHKFQNVDLTVRRPPPNDPRKIVLRGLKPQITDDTLILYLECIADCSSDQFTVHYGQDRLQALVHFKEALSAEALEKMKRKAGSRALQSATINIEQLPRTDRILVENLSPADDKDILSLYFESRRSDGGSVLDVTMVSPGTAIVVFQEWEAVDRVLQKCQKLQDHELFVRPYYDFLQLSSTDRECDRQAVETQAEVLAEVTSVINAPDMGKMNILHSSTFLRDLRNECSELSLTIDANNCVCVRGTDPLQIEKTKSRILEFLSKIAQVDVPISEDQAKLFSRGDIRDHLQNVLGEKGLPTCFSISDGALTITAPSVPVAHQAAHLIEQQISQFSISISDRQLHVLTSPDWEKLLLSLKGCEARISDAGDQVCLISLKCFRAENEERVKDLLDNSVSGDLVIGMEPGKLRFLQEYYQDYLAGSAQVSIFPLEGDTAGLRITGLGSACETVDELLRSIASNICSRTLTLQKPGICRFLREERGINVLKHLEIKYKCTIGLEGVRWIMLQTEHPLEIQNSQAAPSFE
ncbi:protein mono-ADP-ribosyltransferase PARP10, partial [Scyliorhinus canicula]|uniref:protein mono-ADP-ribosyltransferase PARP10 n=1 Tax=Scyliorhinus canicula TaxID=7830 RepID=UPI0018F7BC9D